MPEVGEPLAQPLGRIPPGIRRRVQPAAGCALPLGLGRQRLPSPTGICVGVLVGDVDNRLVFAALQRAARPFGTVPAGARRPRPPLAQMAQIDGSRRHPEHQRAGNQVLRRRAGKVIRVKWALGYGDVSGVLDELRELAICHLKAIDPESVDGDVADGRLLWIVGIRAHPERAGRDPGHPLARTRADKPGLARRRRRCRFARDPHLPESANTVAQSSFMLITVHCSASARSNNCSAPASYSNSRSGSS